MADPRPRPRRTTPGGGGARRRADWRSRRSPEEQFTLGCLGSLAALGVSGLIGLAATLFLDHEYLIGILWLFIVPGLIAPAAGFSFYLLFRRRWPPAGRGAIIFGIISFLVTATCSVVALGVG